MAKINYENELIGIENYYNINKEKIDRFIFGYFEIESLLTAKFPSVKRKPSSNKSEIKYSNIKREFEWDEELVKSVFYGKEGAVPKTCRLLRNSIVHSLKNRRSAMTEIVERYDELITKMSELKTIILNEKQ